MRRSFRSIGGGVLVVSYSLLLFVVVVCGGGWGGGVIVVVILNGDGWVHHEKGAVAARECMEIVVAEEEIAEQRPALAILEIEKFNNILPIIICGTKVARRFHVVLEHVEEETLHPLFTDFLAQNAGAP